MTLQYGDIHWIDFPNRGGHEQSGRRPGLIWLDDPYLHLPAVLVIPFTSKLATQRYDGTYLIQPTSTNGLATPSVALVFQLGAFDCNRIQQRMGQIDDPDLKAIADIARKLQRM